MSSLWTPQEGTFVSMDPATGHSAEAFDFPGNEDEMEMVVFRDMHPFLEALRPASQWLKATAKTHPDVACAFVS